MNNQTSAEKGKVSVIPEVIGWCIMLYAIAIPIYCKIFYDGSGFMPVWLKDHFAIIKSWPMPVYCIFYFAVFRVLYAALRGRQPETSGAECMDECELTDSEYRDEDGF